MNKSKTRFITCNLSKNKLKNSDEFQQAVFLSAIIILLNYSKSSN
ncbi:hypothetical protein [Clostridium sp. BL-8]|nr:hypothetical protein [Clostridium sp. BL-8]